MEHGERWNVSKKNGVGIAPTPSGSASVGVVLIYSDGEARCLAATAPAHRKKSSPCVSPVTPATSISKSVRKSPFV